MGAFLWQKKDCHSISLFIPINCYQMKTSIMPMQKNGKRMWLLTVHHGGKRRRKFFHSYYEARGFDIIDTPGLITNINPKPLFGYKSIDELIEVKRGVWFLGIRKLLHAVQLS
jgi:hypothetical protein